MNVFYGAKPGKCAGFVPGKEEDDMDIFQEVKGTISMQEVVAGYGIKPNRGGMIRSPFTMTGRPA